MATVSQVLQAVGASIDQDTTLPSGTELTTRVQFADRSQKDWAESYDWTDLRVKHEATVSNSMTSLGLPGNFDHLASPIWDYSGGIDSPYKYLEIKSNERFRKVSSEKYVWIMGNDVTGRSLQFNPALASGASIVFDFVSTPSSLATLSDVVTCPSSQFMAKRIEYYILQSRSDNRFPIAKAESDEIMRKLIENEDTPSGGENNRIPDWMTSTNYRPGID